jgi:hypothetical protein
MTNKPYAHLTTINEADTIWNARNQDDQNSKRANAYKLRYLQFLTDILGGKQCAR